MRIKVLVIYKRPISGSFEIGPAAWDRLIASRQLSRAASETGGILLGRWILGSHDVLVDEATTPDQHDRAGLFFFFRAQKPAQKRVNESWQGSRGTVQYLGEWHTHPEDYPTPSPQDLENWQSILRSVVTELDALFFVIVGRVSSGVWEGSTKTRIIASLRPQNGLVP